LPIGNSNVGSGFLLALTNGNYTLVSMDQYDFSAVNIDCPLLRPSSPFSLKLINRIEGVAANDKVGNGKVSVVFPFALNPFYSSPVKAARLSNGFVAGSPNYNANQGLRYSTLKNAILNRYRLAHRRSCHRVRQQRIGNARTRAGSNWGGGNICTRKDDSWAIGSPAYKSNGLTNSGLISFQEYYNSSSLIESPGSFAGGQLGMI